STDANTLCPGPVVSCSTGAVFVYDNVAGQLELVQTIVPPDAELYDNFGISLDVDGTRLVVGSLFARNPSSGERTGAIFVYEFDGVEWVEVDRIWPPASLAQDFPRKLHLIGNALVATPVNAVNALVYMLSGTGDWELLQILEHPDPSQPPAGFGFEWASMGDWLVTGAYMDRRVHPGGGAVFVFRRSSSGVFEIVQELFPDEQRMWMGASVGFAGSTLLVGAPVASRDVPFQGIVRLYEYDGERWVLSGEVAQDRPRDGRKFGMVVYAEGDRIFATASEEWTADSIGVVYGFERDREGRWAQTDRFVPTSAFFARQYGSALTSDGRHLLAAARQDESSTGEQVGAAYFFDLSCGACTPDLDLDGALTIFDFLLFSNLFQDGDAQADFDGDGELTVLDFLAFQDAFDAGC
ncbi:MAG: GC-type dockerin domain-anchored protein, partial [Phycisphaerales bacterium]